jgi:hypothetical protein
MQEHIDALKPLSSEKQNVGKWTEEEDAMLTPALVASRARLQLGPSYHAGSWSDECKATVGNIGY